MKLLKKKKMIDSNLLNYYFKYSGTSNMYKQLNEEDTENNQVKVDFIKDDMNDLKEDIENASRDDKYEKINTMAGIVELILYFNNEDQGGSGLKILTLSQMLSRLPIFLS